MSNQADAAIGRIQVGSTNDERSDFFDPTPMFAIANAMSATARDAVRNPYSILPHHRFLKLSKELQKVTNLGAAHPNPIARNLSAVMARNAQGYAEAARQAIKLRMSMGNELMKLPTQTIPLTVTALAAGASIGPFVVQNPYIGSGGAVANSQGIWAITGCESGALINTGGMLTTSAIFAGHDYVNASLGGIQGTNPAAAVTQGWGWYIWASDKRARPHTTFSPWNLQGAAGIVGSIMRETGTASFTFYNNGTQPFSGVFHVHVKASLCGSPFKASETEVAKQFVPWHQQMAAAARVAHTLPAHLGRMFQGQLPVQLASIRGLEDGYDIGQAVDWVLADAAQETGYDYAAD